MNEIQNNIENNLNTDITTKSFQSAIWMFFSLFCVRVTRFISFIILARILEPKDFGILAIATMTIGVLEVITSLGFEVALIQKKGDVYSYLDTAWVTNIVRGLIISLILFIFAPLIALFFKIPAARDVVRIVGFTAFMNGFTNIGTLFFFKELDLKKKFYMEFSGVLSYAVISIFLSFLLRNVWALVGGYISLVIVNIIFSYILSPYRPHLYWNYYKAKEMLEFGKWILGLNIGRYISSLIDEGFVGKIIDATSLGFYNKAKMIANLPLSLTYNVVSKVAFPMYSKIQDSTEDISRKFCKILDTIFSFSLPFAAVVLLLGDELIEFILGRKWLPMCVPLKALLLVMIIQTVLETCYPLFKGLGRPDIEFKVNVLQLVITTALLYPLTKSFNMLGTAIASLSGSIFVLPICLNQLLKTTNLNLKFNDIIRSFICPTVGIVIISGITIISQQILGRNVLAIIAICIILIFMYLIYLYLCWRYLKIGPYPTIIKLLKMIRGNV